MTLKDLEKARRVYATLPDPKDPEGPRGPSAPEAQRVYYDLVTREPMSLVVGGGTALAWHVKVRRAGDKYDAGGWYLLAALHAETT